MYPYLGSELPIALWRESNLCPLCPDVSASTVDCGVSCLKRSICSVLCNGQLLFTSFKQVSRSSFKSARKLHQRNSRHDEEESLVFIDKADKPRDGPFTLRSFAWWVASV